VIVTDSRGNFVEGLRREDFHLFDNAVEQPISDFAAIEDQQSCCSSKPVRPSTCSKGHLEAAHSLLNGSRAATESPL